MLHKTGSFASDAEKTSGSGTYHRPKLPTSLVRNPSPLLGKIVPMPSNLNSKSNAADGNKDENFLTQTQKLVAQLEQRTMTNGSPLLNGDVKQEQVDSTLIDEDPEVTEAFLNSAAGCNSGINRRLLAMLQRRNPPLKSPESTHRSRSENVPEEDFSRREANAKRRTGAVVSTSRPRSQQPTSRMTLYNVDPDQRERGSSTTRNGSSSRITRYLYPENGGQSNSRQLFTQLRDGWDTSKGKQQQQPLTAKSASIASPRLYRNSQEAAKISALMNWQRRKAYDPRSAIAQNSARISSRASAQSLRDDDPASSSTDDGKRPQLQQQPQETGNQKATTNSRIFYRNKNINRRTAPVETSDCIDALTSIRTPTAAKAFPAHCSVVSTLLTPSRPNRTGAGYIDPTARMLVGRSRPGMEPSERKKRSPRALSLNNGGGDSDPNYPDIGVESIRYKIEKLTNFIVRMRKRIERDYAEQGTCSPGDDMFGDEAIGATVAGRPTGMHPVVASSLKNLRILEFNAQEIFSLLYPTEVDMWEPARACLTGDIGDEKSFHEARSKLTEHIVNTLQDNDDAAPGRTTPTQQQTPEERTPTAVVNPKPFLDSDNAVGSGPDVVKKGDIPV
ncbi:unnamed protein product [Echinostoma caproni]|uniref:Serine/arginine repetitive matrix protein 2 n=1 Tax=Echinostoma caproni TaxID=27848 RepID=A0A183AJ79_9TREM|nr:unnamed protein product [Echinostoma caproni]